MACFFFFFCSFIFHFLPLLASHRCLFPSAHNCKSLDNLLIYLVTLCACLRILKHFSTNDNKQKENTRTLYRNSKDATRKFVCEILIDKVREVRPGSRTTGAGTLKLTSIVNAGELSMTIGLPYKIKRILAGKHPAKEAFDF